MLTFSIVGLVLVAGWYFILRAITRELRVSRLQSDFVAAVSHEFRSPLTSMSHIAEMLAQDRFRDEAVRRKAFDVLVREQDRIQRRTDRGHDQGDSSTRGSRAGQESENSCADGAAHRRNYATGLPTHLRSCTSNARMTLPSFMTRWPWN